MQRYDGKIILVDDDPGIRDSGQMFLKQVFPVVRTESSPQNLVEIMKQEDFDVILLDMNFQKGEMDGKEGLNWLEKILETDPEAMVVFITAYGDIDLAIQSIKAGAADFIVKPWSNQKLLATILSCIRLRKAKTEVIRFKKTSERLSQDMDKDFQFFIGDSYPVKKIKEMIARVAETDADVLILGENGTGKELVAREVHRESTRKDQVFIAIDLGAVPETLFESELFGHVKGAYTDAYQDRPGRFELATGGTIFLDEIGNLSHPLQSKLLSVIENRKIIRIGSHIEIPVDVRLISATNRNLKQMVNERRFREDLLYRINTVEIHLPALRERKNDIPLLVDHFLEIYRQKYHKSELKISQHTLRKLKNYPWPGNIRELKNAVERAVILSSSGQLSSANLFPTSYPVPAPELQNIFNLEENEKQLIMKAINHNRGNMTRTARELGIARAALYRRMKKFGL